MVSIFLLKVNLAEYFQWRDKGGDDILGISFYACLGNRCKFCEE